MALSVAILLFAALLPAQSPRAVRLPGNPMITPAHIEGPDGENINGPSLIRVPDWVRSPLGKYYLYFAHHNGKYIRMAYADNIEGPWKVREGGVLRMADQESLKGHVASPEAVIDAESRRIALFFHGRPPNFRKRTGDAADDEEAGQKSAVAFSPDGLNFETRPGVVANAYLRVFRHRGTWYGVAGKGELLLAPRLGERFETIGNLIGDDILALVDPAKLGEPGAVADRPRSGGGRYSVRHTGLDLVGDTLTVYFSCAGHRPERILATTVSLTGPPSSWRAAGVMEILRPEHDWEGARHPLVYSKGGRARGPENGLRDPAVFRQGAQAWLIYSIAGESGLAIARLETSKPKP